MGCFPLVPLSSELSQVIMDIPVASVAESSSRKKSGVSLLGDSSKVLDDLLNLDLRALTEPVPTGKMVCSF